MEGGFVDRAELIKWWDALDTLAGTAWCKRSVTDGVEMARESAHPDAQWLVSLFPADVQVTRGRMRKALLEQGEDPRALYLIWALGDKTLALLARAAELGNARAQVRMSHGHGPALYWAEKAMASGDRDAIARVASCLGQKESSSDEDTERAMQLYMQAVELEHPPSQYYVGQHVYGKYDWQRYYWWCRAASHGFCVPLANVAILKMCPEFKKGLHGRILHTIATAFRVHLDVAKQQVFGAGIPLQVVRKFSRLMERHEAMLNRAREALRCWSMTARRFGMAKDIRVMIAEMMWEEVWLWGEKRESGAAELQNGSDESSRGCVLE
jgi:hypothetical protein